MRGCGLWAICRQVSGTGIHAASICCVRLSRELSALELSASSRRRRVRLEAESGGRKMHCSPLAHFCRNLAIWTQQGLSSRASCSESCGRHSPLMVKTSSGGAHFASLELSQGPLSSRTPLRSRRNCSQQRLFKFGGHGSRRGPRRGASILSNGCAASSAARLRLTSLATISIVSGSG